MEVTLSVRSEHGASRRAGWTGRGEHRADADISVAEHRITFGRNSVIGLFFGLTLSFGSVKIPPNRLAPIFPSIRCDGTGIVLCIVHAFDAGHFRDQFPP
jgi:hypothetical protein